MGIWKTPVKPCFPFLLGRVRLRKKPVSLRKYCLFAKTRTAKGRKLTSCCWLLQGQIISMSRPCTSWRKIRSIKKNVDQSHCPNLRSAAGTYYWSAYITLWIVLCHRIGKSECKFFYFWKMYYIQNPVIACEKITIRRELIDELNFYIKKKKTLKHNCY